MRHLLIMMALAAGLNAATPVQAKTGVDLELVLAVDVSRSMDHEEQLLQRKGYAEAFRSPEVIQSILSGVHGSIAVTYVEWAGTGLGRTLVPWMHIDSEAAAAALAGEIEKSGTQRLSRTSISYGLLYAAQQFGNGGFEGFRKVIDISGDGPNNQGARVDLQRDEIVARGIVINGLPLMVRPSQYGFGIDNLDEYYTDCVIGGSGAFMLPVFDWKEFPQAVKRKLVLEISGLEPQVPITKIQYRDPVDCLVGERLWELRMRDMEWR